MPFAPSPFDPSAAVRRSMRRALEQATRQSPVLVLDLTVVRGLLAELRAALPGVRVLYAVKACDHPQVLRLFVDQGVGFDVASANELDAVVAAGGSASDVSYGNPVKPRAQVAAAHRTGVRRFVADCEAELDKLAEVAPGSEVLVRVGVDQTGADWPLADKYGTDVDGARRLIDHARRAGLDAAGLTFHVGSQQRRPEAFADAVYRCADLMAACGLRVLNLGGGWPADVRSADPALAEAAQCALQAAADLPAGVTLECEPGRALVAGAGTVVSTVVGLAERGGTRWAYLDVGLYSGLLEADGEVTRYPLWTDAAGDLVPTVLAGPTCDSTDVLYRRVSPMLPEGLREGSTVLLGGAGAYTSCYATVGFNGFAPPSVVVVDEDVLEAEVVGLDRPVVQPA